MKKLMLFGLVALLAVGTVAPPASATYLPPGTYAASVKDRSSLFDDGTPTTIGAAPAVGDEQRTIFKIDQISSGSVSEDALGVPVISGDVVVGSYTGDALSGMLYDIVIETIVEQGLYDDLYFEPGTRYTSSGGGGTDGIWTDAYTAGSDVGAVTTAMGYGGIVVVYDDLSNTPQFTGSGGGHNDWVEEGGPAIAGVMDDTDSFPTISDGDPWLVMVLAPLGLQDPLDDTVLVEYGVNAGSKLGWSGIAFANVIGGSFASLVEPDFFGPGWDVRLEFEVESVFSGGSPTLIDGWQTKSDDPVQISIIPEPATMSLLGLSLLGLVGVRVRRKK
jgi:hypothetical protein